jgi:hypothetical protein
MEGVGRGALIIARLFRFRRALSVAAHYVAEELAIYERDSGVPKRPVDAGMSLREVLGTHWSDYR